MSNKSVHIGSQELHWTEPWIMGILNVTPDSFYAPSRVTNEVLVERARKMILDGATILDIGGCSTRPGGAQPDMEEEWRRVQPALRELRISLPEAILSLDTYRPEVARRALEEFGEMIINDVTGGDKEMYDVVRSKNVPYVLTRKKPTCDMSDMQLIVDPGIGFLGSTAADFSALRNLHKSEWPILIGVSRKSLIWRTLDITPDESLAPTQALHMYALMHGADILRVHDVREAAQTIKLFEKLKTEVIVRTDGK